MTVRKAVKLAVEFLNWNSRNLILFLHYHVTSVLITMPPSKKTSKSPTKSPKSKTTSKKLSASKQLGEIVEKAIQKPDTQRRQTRSQAGKHTSKGKSEEFLYGINKKLTKKEHEKMQKDGKNTLIIDLTLICIKVHTMVTSDDRGLKRFQQVMLLELE
jgi:hypothetical protein